MTTYISKEETAIFPKEWYSGSSIKAMTSQSLKQKEYSKRDIFKQLST